MSWTCSTCGEVHQGTPLSFAWDAPEHWAWLSEEERADRGDCTADLCWMIDDAGTPARFVRGTIELPILDSADDEDSTLVFGVWASLSEASFDRYVALGDSQPPDGEAYFGWLCNQLPGYPDTLNVPTDVLPREPGIRPLIVPQRGDHPLQRDQHGGITMHRARELSLANLH